MTPLRAALLAGLTLLPVAAHAADPYRVAGVEDEDLLKMRAGPGTGFDVIVGLPNGTRLLVQSCERSGATVWCKVSLDRARRLKGYVSQAYIRPE